MCRCARTSNLSTLSINHWSKVVVAKAASLDLRFCSITSASVLITRFSLLNCAIALGATRTWLWRWASVRKQSALLAAKLNVRLLDVPVYTSELLAWSREHLGEVQRGGAASGAAARRRRPGERDARGFALYSKEKRTGVLINHLYRLRNWLTSITKSSRYTGLL